jgi:hypothetical protein
MKGGGEGGEGRLLLALRAGTSFCLTKTLRTNQSLFFFHRKKDKMSTSNSFFKTFDMNNTAESENIPQENRESAEGENFLKEAAKSPNMTPYYVIGIAVVVLVCIIGLIMILWGGSESELAADGKETGLGMPLEFDGMILAKKSPILIGILPGSGKDLEAE